MGTVHPKNDETKEVINLLGYETTDADSGPVVRFALFLLAFTIATAALVVLFYKYLDARETAEKAQRYPMSEMVQRPLPPRPRLQTYPFTDIGTMRATEHKLLDEYGWVDKSTGVVRIPIERAIDVLAERGLPHRAAPPAGTSTSPPSQQPAASEEHQGAH